jgi:hypothetical protein
MTQFLHVVHQVFDLNQDKVQNLLYSHLVDTIQEYNQRPIEKEIRFDLFSFSNLFFITRCGALRTLCILFNWLLNTVDVRKVKDGGRAGSGKFTLENGSISSRYCIRHCNVGEDECILSL